MKKEQFLHEHQRFSIRKYSFGAASVLLGASLVFAGQALADEQGNLLSGQDGTKLAVTAETGQASSELAELATVSQAPELSAASSQAISETLSQATSEHTQASQETSVSTSASTASVTSEASHVTSAQETSETQSELSSQAVANSESPVTVRAAVEVARPSGESRFFNVGESSPRQAVSELPSSGTYVYKKRTELKNEPKLSAPTQFYVNAGDSVFYDQVVTADGYQWISYKSYSGVRRYAPVLPAVSGSGKPKEDKADTKPVSDGSLDIPDKGTFVFQRNTDIKTEPKAATKPTFVFSKGDHVIYDKVLKEDGHQWISYLGFDYKRYYADVATLTEATPAKPELPASGTYTFTGRSSIKAEPKLSSPELAYYDKGMSVNYDKVLTADGRTWLSYLSTSGNRRYVDIAKAATEPSTPAQPAQPAKPTTPVDTKPVGKLTIANTTADGFDVLVSNVSAGDKTIQAVAVPVWSVKNGQDDLKWLSAQKQADGTYKTHVAISDHMGDRGDYFVHLYYQIDGKRSFVTATKTAVPQPQSEETGKAINLPETGTYTFTKTAAVKNEAKASAATEFTFEQGDVLTYDKVLTADGHQWLSYVSYNGNRRYVDIATLSAQALKPTGKLSVSQEANGRFDVVVSQVPQINGLQEVQIPVWTAKNGQDDIVWHKAVKQSDGSYKVTVTPEQHKNERGDYFVHAYYLIEGKRVFLDATKVTLPQANAVSGTIAIQDKSASGFDVVISQVFGGGDPVQEVQVPVWSVKDSQDDLKWYTATKQADGTYRTHVAVSDHKGDYGDYFVHLYYKIDGKRTFVTATKTTVPQAQKQEFTGAENLPATGTYQVTRTLNVKNQPKASAPTEFTLEKGNSINYDKVLIEDDHQWISYISYNGTRRYVDIVALKAVDNKPQEDKLAGKIAINNLSSNGFDVVISDISSAGKTLQEVLVPVWSVKDNQDDIKWYSAVKQADGSYKTHVAVSDHKGDHGDYLVHLYYKINGKLEGVGGTGTKVPEADKKGHELTHNGNYYSVRGKYDDIIIVNKKHGLSADYNPGENPTAKAAFTRLRDDMINQGLNVGRSYSGFRTYAYQKTLYDNYVARDGQAAADRYSARPGFSEHQIGLVFDLTDKSGNLLEDARASQWLRDNAHNYGFIVRYQAGKEASTGYMPEAWHIRYVGKEAKDIHDSGLSLEEYFGVEGGDYAKNSQPTQPAKPELPSSGTYTFTGRASIKAEPKLSSPELAYYDKGMSVNYDKVVTADGRTWLSYLSTSGNRRYVDIAKATTEPSTPAQPAKPELPSSGTYTFTDRASIKAEPKQSSPELAYYDKGMSVNYDKVVTADGRTWLSYLSTSGNRRYVDIAEATSAPAQPAKPELPASGRYNFTKRASIKAEAKDASPELAYFDAGMSVNYDKVLTADGHTWISYMTFSGNRRYVPVD